MINVCFSISCLLFLSIILIFYFSKKRLNNIDNKIFSILIILNLIGIFIDVFGYFSFNAFGPKFILNVFISKIYLVYYLMYVFCLMTYVYSISFNNIKKVLPYFITIFSVISVIIFILPVNVHMKGNVAFSYGVGVNFGYVMAFIAILIMIFSLIKNVKKIKSKEYIPIFVFVISTFLTLIIQKINPQITLLLLSNSIVTTLMYFTIENPDVKLIKELNENRILVEKTNEEKSNFLFKMSQELKSPVLYMEEVSSSLLNEEDNKKIKDGINSINMSSRKLSYIINNVLDVSSIDSKKIKTVNSKYNIYAILDEIKTRLSKNVKSGVDFRFYVNDNIPTSLYGDVIKLKQVITTILNNSIKHTNSGFIEVNVDSLIKYDVCRLVISIEDSGKGMNISKVNELLRLDDELSDEDIKKLEKLDSDLKIAKKIIKVLGGNLMIKSEEDKGSEFIIVLDQKIVNTNDKCIFICGQDSI